MHLLVEGALPVCWDSIGHGGMCVPVEELDKSEEVKSKVSYQKRVYVTKFERWSTAVKLRSHSAPAQVGACCHA